MRHAEELSTTMAPARAAIGENSLLTELGVELRTICTPANASGRIGSTGCCFPLNSTVLPALFSDARNLMAFTGKCRSASTRRIKSPTAPVAPATATFTDTAHLRGWRKAAPTATGKEYRISLTGTSRGRCLSWERGRPGRISQTAAGTAALPGEGSHADRDRRVHARVEHVRPIAGRARAVP